MVSLCRFCSGAITWFSKAFQPYSSGDLYPNTTKKAAGLGLVSGQDPGHPRLREPEVLLENPLHPTLQLGKLGQNAGYYLSQTTESISVRSREAEMEKKNGVELTTLLVVRVAIISKAD